MDETKIKLQNAPYPQVLVKLFFNSWVSLIEKSYLMGHEGSVWLSLTQTGNIQSSTVFLQVSGKASWQFLFSLQNGIFISLKCSNNLFSFCLSSAVSIWNNINSLTGFLNEVLGIVFFCSSRKICFASFTVLSSYSFKHDLITVGAKTAYEFRMFSSADAVNIYL